MTVLLNKFRSVVFVIILPAVSFSQVKLQTGEAEANIPVYSFTDNLSRLNLELEIKYSSGWGILVDEIPGNIGTKWAINGIPKIMRLQKGLPDDQMINSSKPAGIIHQNKFVGLRGCPDILNYYPISDKKFTAYDDPLITANDQTVDEFQVFLNGRLITFYLRTKLGVSHGDVGVIKLNGKERARIFAYTDLPPIDNIRCRTTITRFEILDTDGLRYVFSNREYSKVFNYSVPQSNLENLNIPRLICREAKNVQDESYIASAWNITKIIDESNKREISFDYSEQILEFENYTNLYAGSERSTYPGTSSASPYLSSVNSVYVTLKKNKIISPQIQNINLPTGESVEFHYDADRRKDVKGAYGLDNIFIKNNQNERKLRFQLNQEYFVKNEIKIPTDDLEEKWSRLCLTSIQKFGKSDFIKEPPYVFTYYLGGDKYEDFVPPIFFHAKDQWGYYNGSDCGISVNDFASKELTSLTDWRNLSSSAQIHHVYQEEEIWATCKIGYAANGLLKSFTRPSGQSVQFNYEQNKTRYSDYPRWAGGVHVSSISISNGVGNVQELIEYFYVMPDGSSSLWGIEPPRCISKITRHYKAEKNSPGTFNRYTWKYPSKYEGIDNSEEVSGSGFWNTVKIGIKIYSAIASIAVNPTPMNIIATIGNLLIDIGDDYINDHEQTLTQYYFHKEPLNFANPLPAQFRRVIVKNSSIEGTNKKENGRMEYEFTSDLDFPPIIPILKPGDPEFNPHFFSQSQRSHVWMYGLPKNIKIFKNNDDIPIQETQNEYENKVTYNSINDITLKSCNCVPIYFDSKKTGDYNSLATDIYQNFTNTSIPNKLYVDFVNVEAGYPLLQKTIETTRNGTTKIVNISNYEYNTTGDLKSHKTTDSKGRILNKRMYYHFDFYQSDIRPDNIFTHLYEQNRSHIPIATETWQQNRADQPEKLIASAIFEYGILQNGDYKLIHEYIFESEKPISKDLVDEFSFTTPPPINRNPSYFRLKNQIYYDQKGVPVQFNNPAGNKKSGVIFGYDQQYRISTFLNAEVNEVAYTSFETAEKSMWEFDASRIVNNVPAITGTKSFQLDWDYYKAIHFNYSLPQRTTKPYILSFWVNEAVVLIGGSMVSALENKNTNGWYFFKIEFATGASLPIINGGGLIDELRWYPKDARMETFSYDNFGNQVAFCDANNRIIYYEYDELNRLILIRDLERNILKKYCYTFQGQQEECDCVGFDVKPNWQNTTSPVRCQKTWDGKNTGKQEAEQRDMNECSQTYDQTRWVITGTNLNSCALPPSCDFSNCSGENKKCINDICETGIKIFTDSYDEGNRSYCVYHYEWSDGSWSQNYRIEVPYGMRCSLR